MHLIKAMMFFLCVATGGGKSIVYQACAMFLKALTLKNLVNTITLQGLYGMLIGLMKTLDEFKNGPSGTPLRALKTLTSKNLLNTITLKE